MQINKYRRKGMSLIETMIAMLILTVVVVTITGLIVQINAFANSTKLRNGAVLLAQDSLEQVRGYYQANGWNVLQTLSGNGTTTGCYTDGTLATQPATCTTQTLVAPNSFYSRVVKIVQNGSQISAQVYIYWNDRSVAQTTESDTSFYSY